MSTEAPAETETEAEALARKASWRSQEYVIAILWVTYGSFYFCRQNISAAIPGLREELGFSASQAGWILASTKIAYAVGQLVNGQLAERFSPRQLLASGMLGSAAMNVVFGFGEGLMFLIFVWLCNGYFQSLGWTPCMRVVGNWVPVSRRGRLVGILGTSYQVSAALTYVIAGWSVHWFGWRAGFFVPAALLAAAALYMLFFLKDAPETPLESSLAAARARGGERSGSWRENLLATVGNPSLWFLAVALLALDACRYGYTDWGLAHLKEVQNLHVGSAALKISLLPLGGIAGALAAGWLSDRVFQGRRAPVIFGFMVALGVLTLTYEWMARNSFLGTLILLVMIGFFIFGPQVMLVGTAPADFARHGTAAAAAGFVNCMGYIGASSGDAVTGYVVEHFGWGVAVQVWAAWAFIGAASVAFLWNKRGHDHRAADPV